jgi:hypothetical protein
MPSVKLYKIGPSCEIGRKNLNPIIFWFLILKTGFPMEDYLIGEAFVPLASSFKLVF